MTKEKQARFDAGVQAWCAETEAFMFQQMAATAEQERLHRQAMATYERWQSDSQRRAKDYDARVDAYHASLREVPDDAVPVIENRVPMLLAYEAIPWRLLNLGHVSAFYDFVGRPSDLEHRPLLVPENVQPMQYTFKQRCVADLYEYRHWATIPAIAAE